jgi:hypothetical protein
MPPLLVTSLPVRPSVRSFRYIFSFEHPTKDCGNESWIFFEYLLPYNNSGSQIERHAAFTSQVRASAMLSLLIMEIEVVRDWSDFILHNVHTKFHEI